MTYRSIVRIRYGAFEHGGLKKQGPHLLLVVATAYFCRVIQLQYTVVMRPISGGWVEVLGQVQSSKDCPMLGVTRAKSTTKPLHVCNAADRAAWFTRGARESTRETRCIEHFGQVHAPELEAMLLD